MRRGWALAIVGLGATAAFMAWVVVRSGAPDSPLAAGEAGGWTGGSPHILAAMLIAGLGAGGLTAALIWLAFFSARRGYDDRVARWEGDDGDDGAG